jgi:hypothetical protein
MEKRVSEIWFILDKGRKGRKELDKIGTCAMK